MLMVVTFLALLSQLPSGRSTDSACVPNTQFLLNGRMCRCNNLGWWTESDCRSIGRSGGCIPGQITWQGCSQCICQESGHLLCSDANCYDEATYRGVIAPNGVSMKESENTWCTPFKSYYINCSICVCPASGRTSEAHCATDTSCQDLSLSSSDFLLSVNKNICIPKVMYLFPCLHCLCSDGGYFILDKCVETCDRPQQTESTRRCISRTFYRKNCNVCWCPDDSMPNDNLCTQTLCNKNSKFRPLEMLRTTRSKCRPYSFLKPKCYYCGCNTNGNVNENVCLELDCLKTNDLKYDVAKTTCSPGEMVPSCVECFCLRTGVTNKAYCSNVCSYQSKLLILDNVLKNSFSNQLLIDRKEIKRSSDDDTCDPNTMYIDQGRYCLCPENGNTNFKLCTSVTEEGHTVRPNKFFTSYVIKEDLNANCTPNTLVQIGCNTCYCAKNGRIDPKWCTYDDCDAKRIIQDTFKANRALVSTMPRVNTTCIPGSISKVDCNYCICPGNGLLKHRACTKNKCSVIQDEVADDQFVCEPLAYYLVDCNVCLCPQDGVKNVEKCTKKICEKTFLRSDSCVPGQFFSNDCNVCVCPPDGNKADKVCTKHRCSDFDTPWKKIFRLSQSLLDNQISTDSKRQIDVCFSGEEFEIDCKICVCPDVGLRSFATCTDSACKEKNNEFNISKINDDELDENVGREISHSRFRREGQEDCTSYNLTDSSERKECTPGSMYIIRCKQCICPYMGNINYFCRPLPAGTYCEQAYPNYNYLPMGRRTDQENTTSVNITTTPEPYKPMNHPHTRYTCSSPGKVLDKCFACECQEDLVLIEEHCFKSNDEKCNDSLPTFLDSLNKVVVT